MNSGTVDLIATDPPFNKGRDFHATPDSLAAGEKFQDRWSWERDVHPAWVDQLENDWPRVSFVINSTRESYGDDMAAYLCFIAVRLIEMHRVLKADGSIYLHCDQTASHYLKQLMDAVFGRRHFRNQIVWFYRKFGAGSKNFKKNHDVILYYSKSTTPTFNRLLEPFSPRTVRNKYKRVLVDGKWDQDKTIPMADAAGNEGVAMGNVWEISFVHSQSKERTGFPTQKPLALYERMILASSHPGDMVLDPFAGCATTSVAAERTGRRWVGIDIWQKAHIVVLDRLEKEGLLGPQGGSLAYRGEIYYRKQPPVRTDDGRSPVQWLKVPERKYAIEPGPVMSHTRMREFLLEEAGPVCSGCDRYFTDPLYLQLDHNMPRSQGGANHHSNRMLLCGPCNRIKSDTLTLKGLRRKNKKMGRMVDQQQP